MAAIRLVVVVLPSLPVMPTLRQGQCSKNRSLPLVTVLPAAFAASRPGVETS